MVLQEIGLFADDATLEPVPGGVVRWTHPNGDSCSVKLPEDRVDELVDT